MVADILQVSKNFHKTQNINTIFHLLNIKHLHLILLRTTACHTKRKSHLKSPRLRYLQSTDIHTYRIICINPQILNIDIRTEVFAALRYSYLSYYSYLQPADIRIDIRTEVFATPRYS